jgi:hypothetical protein
MKTAALAAIALAFLALTQAPVTIVGDGSEYLCVAHSWLENGSPVMTDSSLRNCIARIARGLTDPTLSLEQRMTIGLTKREGGYWGPHFWQLPLLAAPFWLLSPLHSYTLLHCALVMAAVLWISKRIGLGRTTLLLLILISSPLVFWSNKAHGEMFLCITIFIAFIEIAGGQLLWAAAYLALASTQQPALAIPAALAAIGRLLQIPTKRISRSDVVAGSLALFFALLAPVYNFATYGHWNPVAQRGEAIPALISWHRAMSLYIDPDLGLFWHWPVGIALAALCIAALRLPRLRMLGVSSGIFCLLLPFLVSLHPNWNSGGTMHISRYAVLLIPVLAVAGILTAVELVGRIPSSRARRAIAVLLTGALVVYVAGWNLTAYSPTHGEVYLARTRYASWLYEYHPSWYDPVPEVYAERAALVANVNTLLTPQTWAIGNFPCTKLLLVRPVEELSAIKEPGNPIGCLTPNDSRMVFEELASGRRYPTRRGYVNIED